MSQPHKVLTDAELAGKLWDENRELGADNRGLCRALQSAADYFEMLEKSTGAEHPELSEIRAALEKWRQS